MNLNRGAGSLRTARDRGVLVYSAYGCCGGLDRRVRRFARHDSSACTFGFDNGPSHRYLLRVFLKAALSQHTAIAWYTVATARRLRSCNASTDYVSSQTSHTDRHDWEDH